MIKRLMLSLFLASTLGSNLLSNNEVILISVPKCGTQLLLKTIKSITQLSNIFSPNGLCLIAQDDLPRFKNGGIYRTHAIYNDENLKIVDNHNFKTFFILRDPRDQIVSMVHFMHKEPHWPDYKHLSIDQLIFELINNGSQIWDRVFACKEVWANLKGIRDFYEQYLPWINHESVYVTTFEKLVGAKGGGNDQIQKEEINKMAQHLGKEILPYEVDVIAKQLFGGINAMFNTFRLGKIGDWKNHFTEEHKIAFKKVAGELLIELGYEADLNW